MYAVLCALLIMSCTHPVKADSEDIIKPLHELSYGAREGPVTLRTGDGTGLSWETLLAPPVPSWEHTGGLSALLSETNASAEPTEDTPHDERGRTASMSCKLSNCISAEGGRRPDCNSPVSDVPDSCEEP